MIWGLVQADHDLAAPFAVPRPLDGDTMFRTVVHNMSNLGEILTKIRMKVVLESPSGVGRCGFINAEQSPDAAWFITRVVGDQKALPNDRADVS